MMLPNCFYFVRLFFRIGIRPIQYSNHSDTKGRLKRFSDGLLLLQASIKAKAQAQAGFTPFKP
jgi:hypothetical protein